MAGGWRALVAVVLGVLARVGARQVPGGATEAPVRVAAAAAQGGGEGGRAGGPQPQPPWPGNATGHGRFDLKAAVRFAEYSAAAYCHADLLAGWGCKRCSDQLAGFKLDAVVRDDHLNLQSYIGVDDGLGAVLIAFRGTTGLDLHNWIADLQITHADAPFAGMSSKSRVHAGFLRAWNSTLREELTTRTRNLMKTHNVLKVVVTGHSLGAGMATLAAVDFRINFGVGSVELHTFGSPRVGNKAFAEEVDGLFDSVRLTHDRDIVAALPPRSLGYWHIKSEVWEHTVTFTPPVGPPTSFTEYRGPCDPSGEDPSCQDSVCT